MRGGPRDDLRMNAALALGKAPPARTAEMFAQLIEDPDPRIRLIAARSVLSQDAADAGAVAVVKAGLTDPVLKVRQAALDLIESLDSGATAWRDALKERSVLEEDPKLREEAARLAETLEAEAGEEAPPVLAVQKAAGRTPGEGDTSLKRERRVRSKPSLALQACGGRRVRAEETTSPPRPFSTPR